MKILIEERNDKGNIIHEKWSNGNEFWRDYDDKGNIIHEKWSNGYECWYDYDDKGNVTHLKKSNGNEYWYDYDENGNVIHKKWSNGGEHRYDADGNEIHPRPADIQEIFNRLATFKNGYLNHYYTQIAGGGNVLMADIKRLEEYVAGLEAQK